MLAQPQYESRHSLLKFLLYIGPSEQGLVPVPKIPTIRVTMYRTAIIPLLCLAFVVSLPSGMESAVSSTGVSNSELTPPPGATKLPAKRKALIISTYERHIAETIPLKVGDPEEDVIVRMGNPDGVMTIGNKKRLSYGPGHIVVSGGRILSISNINKDRLSAPDLDSYNDYQEAKGLIYYMGQWMTEEQGQRLYEKSMTAKDLADARVQRGKIEVARQQKQHVMTNTPIVDIRQGGKRINKQDLIVPGKITIVDFYADWCGPCKVADPYLKAFAEDPDVFLRKVDIVSWRTAVTQQWKIRSIPNMRVYDRNGNEVGKPTASLKEVYDNIQKAK